MQTGRATQIVRNAGRGVIVPKVAENVVIAVDAESEANAPKAAIATATNRAVDPNRYKPKPNHRYLVSPNSRVLPV